MEAVIMDYDGEPVIIEDGELLVVYPDDGEHWNSTTRQFEPDDDDDDEPRGDEDDYDRSFRKLYGGGWDDCNTNPDFWRRLF